MTKTPGPDGPLVNPDLARLSEVRSALSGIIGMLALFALAFFSGFGALGTTIFHHQDQAFFRTALEAEAHVEEIRDAVRRRTRTESSGRSVTTTETTWAAHVRFTDDGGATRTAVVGLGPSTSLQAGDVIRIAYQPGATGQMRLAEAAGNVSTLLMMSRIFTGVFLVSLVALVLLHRRRRAPPTEFPR